MGKTIFDKIWEKHLIKQINEDLSLIYIDKHFIHEVTSPQAFSGIEARKIPIFRKDRIVATADHNIPTVNQDKEIKDALSRTQVNTLIKNCKKHNIELYGLNHPYNGIVHVIGPELGITQPGMTIVCGDSHTSTHGAFGTISFGIGTSQVEMVMATQCLLQNKPKRMRININGKLSKRVTSKDVILYIISKISTSGGNGHFVEYSGSTFTNMSMEERMTVCNMSIEMGAKGGLIAADKVTFDYIRGRVFAPKDDDFYEKVSQWKGLSSDKDAVFDKEYNFDASDIEPMITFGTNPGMGIKVNEKIPEHINDKDAETFEKAIKYMGFKKNTSLLGKKIDYVFIGSCTNGRIEDLRLFADAVRGRKKAKNITALIVPGSKQVEKQAIDEGILNTLREADFELRSPGCSACLGMNDDKVPEGKYCISTSNRNFEGRQGPNSRTLLASPLTAAAAAVNGFITDPRDF